MKRAPAIVLALLALGGFMPAVAGVIREDFNSDPANRGWRVQGNSSQFAWTASQGRLAVTWDSKQANAFYLRPLPTILTRADDFLFRFTLVLEDIQTGSAESTFQIASGLIRRTDAFAPASFRGAGIHPVWGPRNLIEFDYFPASQAITPTFSAVAVATNNARWAYLDLFPYTLEPGHAYLVEIRHRAAESTLELTVLQDGQPFTQGITRLDTRFGDFRVDAFSVTSYSGEHQPAGYGGNVLAHGWIDDVTIEFPDPPTLVLTPPDPQTPSRIATSALPGWTPILERRAEGGDWAELPVRAESVDNHWLWTDPTPPETAALYRVRLERP